VNKLINTIIMIFLLPISVVSMAEGGIDALDSNHRESVIIEVDTIPKVGDQIQVNHIQGGGIRQEYVIYSDGRIIETLDSRRNHHIYYINPGHKK
jgi:hypothetical protein